MGHRLISDELSIEDSTSISYLTAKAEMEDALASIGMRKKGLTLRDSWRSHYQQLLTSLFGLGAGLQMARERWRSIRGTRMKPYTSNLHK